MAQAVKLKTSILVIDADTISDLTWPGVVSAAKLAAGAEVSQKDVTAAIARLNDFYVPVNPKAKTRCIDGRQDPNADESNLGPQVPGGVPGAALAYRLGVDRDDLTRGTFLADAEDMIRRFVRLGFTVGGHRDEGSQGKNMVGCGVIDGMDQILQIMTNPDLVDDHKRVVEFLLGEEFDRDTYLRIMGAAVIVNGRPQDYFRNREAVIDMLEQVSKKSVSILKGSHRECIVAVNFVPGTTLASNRISKQFGGVQAFGYDLWRSKQMAARLLPCPDQATDRQRFIMARVMTTVAALMALTDGSQHLVLCMPS